MGLPRLSRLDKNYIINGNFDFFQRAISGGIGYVADRFRTSQLVVDGADIQQSKSLNVPFGYGNSLKVECLQTVAQASGTVFGMTQGIEGLFFRDLIGKKVTLTIYARANHVANYAMGLVGNGTQSINKQIDFPVANQWERFDLTTIVPQDAWETEEDVAASLLIELLSNPDNHTANEEVWEAGTKRGVITQDNFLDTIGNEIEISKVMLTIGEPKEDEVFIGAGRDYLEEKQLIDRFYHELTVSYFSESPNVVQRSVSFSTIVPMREKPSVSELYAGDAALNKLNIDNGRTTKDSLCLTTGGTSGTTRTSAAIFSLDADF